MPKLIRIILLLLAGFTSYTSSGQVTAGFTVDSMSGCAPLVVHFYNTSTGATSYHWNLGNSTVSSLPNPSVGYLTPGTYVVRLTAYNGTDSSFHLAAITVYPKPTVAFTANDTTICPGTMVTYTNGSVGGTPGITSYTWNFGDGSTSTITSPGYAHPTPGNYNITLFAVNSRGCSSSLSKSSYVHVYTPPVPSFPGFGTHVCRPPVSVSFTNGSTGTSPLAYRWSFGDGVFSTLNTPAHTYTAVGSYNVKLRVTDGDGCADSVIVACSVNASTLHAAFGSVSSVCDSSAAPFFNMSSPHISSTWQFGDSTVSSIESPVHIFPVPGVYNVRLIIDDGSCYDTVIHALTVHPIPAGTINISPAEPCPVPVTVTYSVPPAPGVTASWQFSGAPPVVGNTIPRSYGIGTIDSTVLTLTGAGGCRRVLEIKDTVYNLHSYIEADRGSGCIPLTTTFTPHVSTYYWKPFYGYVELPVPYTGITYTWDFGDGSSPVTSPSPTHIYATVDTAIVKCVLHTAGGCTDSSSMYIMTGIPPAITFTATPTHICAGRNVDFRVTPTGTVSNYDWYFGDGLVGGSVDTFISHRYRTPGTFFVGAAALYNGCSSSFMSAIIVVDSPGASPQYSYLCIPNNGIQFADSSLGADSRLWLFGDGDTSSLRHPVHYYPSLSSFDAYLTTYNAHTGCRDTERAVVKLTPLPTTLIAKKTRICQHDEDSLIAFMPASIPTRIIWLLDGAVISDSMLDTVVTHIHTPGYHTVQLLVKNYRGCYDTVTKPNYIISGSPVSSFLATPPAMCGPNPIAFSEYSLAAPGAPLVQHEWSFGDGGSFVSGFPGTTHIYGAGGVFNVTLKVTDTNGCISVSSPVPVTVYRPQASFFADAPAVCYGFGVHFNNTSSAFLTSLWIFGDGSTSTLFSPDHTYSAPGVYTVKLVVTDSSGCRDTATMVNYITINPSPVSAFTMNDSIAVCPPLNVNFTNTSTGASTYKWDFGNSTSSLGVNPACPYITPGYYTVRLIARTAMGCRDTSFAHVRVYGYTGAFTYSPLAGCLPLPVHFSAVIGNVSGVVWDFGDGTTSGSGLSDTISHTYITQGLYVPKLILTDSTGCSSASIGLDTVIADILVPGITIVSPSICSGGAIAFADSSSAMFAPPVAWLWSYDGIPADTIASPSHVFTITGTHTVTLSVSNGIGCNAVVTKNFTVNPLPAVITGQPATCLGSSITLSTASTGGTWSSSDTAIATVSSSGTVSGIAYGTVHISYTLPTGCLTTIVVSVSSVTIAGADSVCVGMATTLVGNPPGGTWSSGSPVVALIGSGSGFLAGMSQGTSMITYSIGGICFTTNEITVNPLPPPITGPVFVCENAAIALTNSAPLGTWSSGDTATAIVDPMTGAVTGIRAGTVYISYTLPTGCSSAILLTVNPVPPPIGGGSSVCTGFALNLTNSVPGGTWYSDPLLVMIGSVHHFTGVVTGVTPGIVPVTYTLSNGCRRTLDVTVIVLPAVIGGPPGVCVGDSIILTNPAAGGVWSSSMPARASIDPVNGLLHGLTTGTAVVTYKVGTGCFNVRTIMVNPLPAPITGPLQVCEGSTITLATTSAGGNWICDTTAHATVGYTSGIVTGIAAGPTNISYVIGATGCLRSVQVTVNGTPAAIMGNPHVCMGSSNTFTDASPGGNWISSNPAVATVSTSGVVTSVSLGVFILSYTYGSTGCTATRVVSVDPLPNVYSVTGGGNYCAGASGVHINLSGSQPGVSYELFRGSSVVGYLAGSGFSLDFGLLTPAGTYTALATDVTSGCKKNMSGSAAVNIIPLVTPAVTIAVSPYDSVCPGQSVTLSPVTATGGTSPTYIWKVNGVSVGTTTAYSFVPANGDVATVVMTSNMNCLATPTAIANKTLTVLPNAMPVANVLTSPNDTVCQFSPITFTADPVYGGASPSYTWLLNGTTAGAGATYSYIPVDGDVMNLRMMSNYRCRLANM